MSTADRLGLGALIMGAIGLGLQYLLPNERWIGWLFVAFALILGAIWLYKEVITKFGKNALFPVFELLLCLFAILFLTHLVIHRSEYCYVLWGLPPQVTDGHLVFPVRVFSTINQPWDNVGVKIRKPERMDTLLYEEVGTLRKEGFATLSQKFAPEFNQTYLIVILTREEDFAEYLTMDNQFKQTYVVWKYTHGYPQILFDSLKKK